MNEIIILALTTSLGSFEIELYPEQAPVTSANFLEYAEEGFFENVLFHRVIPGFVIQGGGFEIGMEQKPTKDPIINEADNGLKNEKYTLSMARTSDPNSATSQFFINLTVENDPFSPISFKRYDPLEKAEVFKLPTAFSSINFCPSKLFTSIFFTPSVL